MSFAPKTIPFNIIDRSYLIAETDSAQGNYFPMSLIAVIKLKETISHQRLVSALQHLAKNSPHLRLAYQLDYQNVCWRRIPDAELDDYLAACVHILPDTIPIEAQIGKLIAVNNEPLSQAINLFIAGQYLMLRMHHSFGDGKFLCLLMQFIICELAGRTVNSIAISDDWWTPIWQLIWQNLSQGSQIMWKFLKSMFAYYLGYQQDIQSNIEARRSPIVSGSAMMVRFKTISENRITGLKGINGNLSFNTLLQVMLGEHLKELNIQHEPVTYTIPVDLRRYLSYPEKYYPSNLSAQIRITLTEANSFVERCVALQSQIENQLHNKMPLLTIPGDWLLALAGKRTYQAVNRDWLLKSTHSDPRRFILSNLGKLEPLFAPVADLFAEEFHPQVVVPLMGGPALVFCFNSFQGQGNIALTYDPQVFSSAQIDEILALLTFGTVSE